MKRSLYLKMVFALSLIVAGGCDDNPTADKPTVTHMIVGNVILRPYVDFAGIINPIYGKGNEIDSVLFADSACEIAKSPTIVEGNNYTYSFTYYQPSDSTRFHSGDTAVVKIFKGGEVAAVHVKLITLPQDTVRIVSPPNHTVVAPSQDFTVRWARVPNADWYSVYRIYDTSSVFGAELTQVYDFAVDTAYSIAGTNHPVDGAYRIFIGAVTGPVPGHDGNVQTETITGSIYCWAIPGVREGWEIVIGTGPDVDRTPGAARDSFSMSEALRFRKAAD